MEPKGVDEFMPDWWKAWQEPEEEVAGQDLGAKVSGLFKALGGVDPRG